MVILVDFHVFCNVSVTPTNRAEHAHLRTMHLRLVLLYFLVVFGWFWYWASRIVSLMGLLKQMSTLRMRRGEEHFLEDFKVRTNALKTNRKSITLLPGGASRQQILAETIIFKVFERLQ